ncbi:serine protease inhibitor 42Dd isoform X2 [Drosophila eugracilis]|uniref:serine protease inhibitor 42Dd isoform X2 n=1 Tax=Drosophila eugracilis TaxID=29029 RepID=UPI0007E6920A|nr:serine protease inhibitor 42Dd isoform X2 [Drosophila eugracilis]
METPLGSCACWLLPLLFLALSLCPLVSSSDVTMADAANQEFARRLALFSINVYGKLSEQKPGENIVFSPFSIQTCAAMARLGAEGETATQLDHGLGLASNDAGQIAQSFHQVLATYQDSQILRIANKIFVMEGYALRQEFDELLTKQFLSAAQAVDFAKNVQAAATINGWVEQRTNNLIKDLVPSSVLNADSRLVLVNAIHFKGTWLHQFPKHATRPDTFHLDDKRSVQVPMMGLKERFRYADLPALDATALELPYKDSDLSMLIVLPNSKTGLSALEEKLRLTTLSQITQALHKTQVVVKLPKFKAEFQVELTDVFRKLGMSRMFSDQAEFGKMLQSSEPLKVSAIIHKAFIDVNEEGTEAAAATGVVVRLKRSVISLDEPIEFLADRPFTYALLHQEDLPLFWGSVVQLEENDIPSSEHDEL